MFTGLYVKYLLF